METPQGLSLTLSWGANRARTFPLGLPLRVVFVVALCAACYEAGRWHGGLEAQLEKSSVRTARVVATAVSAELREDGTGMAPGQAPGEAVDVITPLNVRDPSALVMPPSLNAPARPEGAPQALETPPSSSESPPARVFPSPSSRLKPDRRF
jgi:hypothetical protein